MQLEARQSIYNTAINAFGDGGVNTNMYVPVCSFMTYCFVDSSKNLYPFLLHPQVQYIRTRENLNEEAERQQEH